MFGLPRTMPYFFAALKVADHTRFCRFRSYPKLWRPTVAIGNVHDDRLVELPSVARIRRFDHSRAAWCPPLLLPLFSLLERRVTGWATRGNDIAMSLINPPLIEIRKAK